MFGKVFWAFLAAILVACVVSAAASAAELAKTRVEVVHPAVAILDAGWKALGGADGWAASKSDAPNMSALLAFYAGRADLPRVGTETVVSRHTAEINKFFADRGYQLRIRELGSQELAVGATFAAELEWLQEGYETRVEIGDKRYKAVGLTSSVRVIEFGGREVVEIQTRSGDVVYVTKVTDRDTAKLAEIEAGTFGVHRLMLESPTSEVRRLDYDAVVLPEIRELNTTFGLRALTGLTIKDRAGAEWQITEAIQQVKFRLDRFGCGVKSAAAAIVSKGIPSTYVVDGPFLIWARRPGVKLPLFAAVIYPDEVGEEAE